MGHEIITQEDLAKSKGAERDDSRLRDLVQAKWAVNANDGKGMAALSDVRRGLFIGKKVYSVNEDAQPMSNAEVKSAVVDLLTDTGIVGEQQAAVLQAYNQSLIGLPLNLINENQNQVSSNDRPESDRIKIIDPDQFVAGSKTANIYHESGDGQVYCDVELSNLAYKNIERADGARQPVPGVIKVRYRLVGNEFVFQQMETSNSLLKELILKPVAMSDTKLVQCKIEELEAEILKAAESRDSRIQELAEKAFAVLEEIKVLQEKHDQKIDPSLLKTLGDIADATRALLEKPEAVLDNVSAIAKCPFKKELGLVESLKAVSILKSATSTMKKVVSTAKKNLARAVDTFEALVNFVVTERLCAKIKNETIKITTSANAVHQHNKISELLPEGGLTAAGPGKNLHSAEVKENIHTLEMLEIKMDKAVATLDGQTQVVNELSEQGILDDGDGGDKDGSSSHGPGIFR